MRQRLPRTDVKVEDRRNAGPARLFERHGGGGRPTDIDENGGKLTLRDVWRDRRRRQQCRIIERYDRPFAAFVDDDRSRRGLSAGKPSDQMRPDAIAREFRNDEIADHVIARRSPKRNRVAEPGHGGRRTRRHAGGHHGRAAGEEFSRAGRQFRHLQDQIAGERADAEDGFFRHCTDMAEAKPRRKFARLPGRFKTGSWLRGSGVLAMDRLWLSL